jgi:hypothetical protein
LISLLAPAAGSGSRAGQRTEAKRDEVMRERVRNKRNLVDRMNRIFQDGKKGEDFVSPANPDQSCKPRLKKISDTARN